jgi:hypothetical protein
MQFAIICSCSYTILQIRVKAYLNVHSVFFLFSQLIDVFIIVQMMAVSVCPSQNECALIRALDPSPLEEVRIANVLTEEIAGNVQLCLQQRMD